MLILVIAVLFALAARAAWVSRDRQRQRQQIEAWFRERDLSIASLEVSSSYGWPHYDIRFNSSADSERFRQSAHFGELLQLVASLNVRTTRSNRAFEPRLAVHILPPPDERAPTGAA